MCSEKSLLWIFSLSIQGLILNSIQGKATSGSTRREVIYIGDGGGDFCPSLQLQKGDHVLARKGWEPSSMNSNLWGSSETQPSTHVLHGRDAALEGTQQFFSSVFFSGVGFQLCHCIHFYISSSTYCLFLFQTFLLLSIEVDGRFPLLKRLQENQNVVKATVHVWSSASDVEAILSDLLQFES